MPPPSVSTDQVLVEARETLARTQKVARDARERLARAVAFGEAAHLRWRRVGAGVAAVRRRRGIVSETPAEPS